MSVVARVSARPVAISTVVELLTNPSEETVSNLPPVKPKAGEVYVYSPGKDLSKKGMHKYTRPEYQKARLHGAT